MQEEMSFAYGHSLVTSHYGKCLITPSSAVIPAESLSHSLHQLQIFTSFSQVDSPALSPNVFGKLLKE